MSLGNAYLVPRLWISLGRVPISPVLAIAGEFFSVFDQCDQSASYQPSAWEAAHP